MAIDRTYKNGGSGKGQAIRIGLDLCRYGENLDKTHGTRSSSCLDCSAFLGIDCIDNVKCSLKHKKVGLAGICDEFIEK